MGLLTHLFGKLFRRQSSMANTVDSKLIGIPEAIRLEFLVNFYGTTPNTKHILAGSGHFQTTTWDLWNPVVNTENFNNQPPSTGEWKPDFWTSAHLEVSIALSYSPQRGESCSPVFRQRFEARFGRGYAHANPKSAPQETTPFTIAREKNTSHWCFNQYLKIITCIYTHIHCLYSCIQHQLLGIDSLNIKIHWGKMVAPCPHEGAHGSSPKRSCQRSACSPAWKQCVESNGVDFQIANEF